MFIKNNKPKIARKCFTNISFLLNIQTALSII